MDPIERFESVLESLFEWAVATSLPYTAGTVARLIRAATVAAWSEAEAEHVVGCVACGARFKQIVADIAATERSEVAAKTAAASAGGADADNVVSLFDRAAPRGRA